MNIFTYLHLITLVFCSFFFTPTHAQREEDYFITLWDLSLDRNKNSSIEFSTATSGNAEYSWETVPAGKSGSGVFSAYNNEIAIKNLPSNAKIKLKISPLNFYRFYFESTAIDLGRNRKIIDVLQWGSVKWISMQFAFYNCENLNISSNDSPDLSGVNSMFCMFMNCYKLNGPTNIGEWNIKNIEGTTSLFANARSFNQPIGKWDTQNIKNMNTMFMNARSFNQPIGTWETQNVTDMSSMFAGATSFNQPVGKWNTQNVTDMHGMFYRASNFNQPIGTWNTQNVSMMYGMFADARSFNQTICNWDIKRVQQMGTMFMNAKSFNQRLDCLEFNQYAPPYLGFMLDSCGMDCSNYSLTLIGWASNPSLPKFIRLGADNVYHGTEAQAARQLLTSSNSSGGKDWYISGDNMVDYDCGLITASEETRQSSKWSIYPNPAQDKLYLKDIPNGMAYQIIDVMGRVVLSGTCNQEQIELSNLNSGLYSLQLGKQLRHFVKE